MNERAVGGALNVGGTGHSPLDVLHIARKVPGLDGRPVFEDRAFREKLADWYVATEAMRLTGLRLLTALSRGEVPGPENSVVKVASANLTQDLANQTVELLDQFGIIDDPEIAPDQGQFQSLLLEVPSFRIAGGTDEILRNIIAERVLGLPGDVRLDKDVPFKDLAVSTPVGRSGKQFA
jgi:alkylation response protein AidB-like acyl-CoA dehydrogenase